MSKNLELSVVVLCYKSGERIIPFARKTKKIISGVTSSFEIILVANYFEGSHDETEKYINYLVEEDPIFKMVCKIKKGMMGWDLKSGLAAASGKYLCYIDGDGQFPIESIAQCFEYIKKGEYGLVKTYRSKRNDGLKREFISVTYNILFKILFPKVSAKDINSKPKIFLKEVYEQLDLIYDDWFIDAEIMIKISRLEIDFYEFPVEFLALKGRRSFVNFTAILEFIRNLLIFRLTRNEQ